MASGSTWSRRTRTIAKAPVAVLDTLQFLTLQRIKVVDLDTGKELPVSRNGAGGSVPLAVPITSDRQSAHLKLTGTLAEGVRVQNGELVFDMTLRGMRQHCPAARGLGPDRIQPVRDDRYVSRPDVRRVHQPEL
jgi:hypothetical protein